MPDARTPRYEVIGVQGLPEGRPGDDVAGLLAAAVDLQDGDVVVVTSKLLSKAEGRLVPVGDEAAGSYACAPSLPRPSGR